jgi:mRNA interferase RelE/StbE
MRTIVFTRDAARQLDALPLEARTRIINALTSYAIDGVGEVKRLSGRAGYRMRVGSYRVLFDEDATTVLAISIGKRETTTYKRN